MNSFQQSTWNSQLENAYQTFWSNWIVSPKEMIETYANNLAKRLDRLDPAFSSSNSSSL